MTAATWLTAWRILAAPIVLVLMLKGHLQPAFWLYVAAALSDALDGWVARRFNQETRLGALLDPMGDKLMMICVFPALVFKGLLEPWVLVTIVARDLIIALGWGLTYVLLGDSDPRTRMPGKISTLAQMFLGASLLYAAAYPADGERVRPYMDGLAVGAVALTIISMLDYLLVGSRRFK